MKLVCGQCRYFYNSKYGDESACCYKPVTSDRQGDMPGCQLWEPEWASDPKLKAQWDKFMTSINLQKDVE